MSEVVRQVRRDIALYKERPEAWKADHDAAMPCLDVEDTLAVGTSLFGRICRLDERLRESFYSGKVPYSAQEEREIEELYRLWATICEPCLRMVESLEQQGFQVEGADKFRLCCKEVAGMLTDDDKFFAGERLSKVRDDAIDSHQKGETAPLGRMSD